MFNSQLFRSRSTGRAYAAKSCVKTITVYSLACKTSGRASGYGTQMWRKLCNCSYAVIVKRRSIYPVQQLNDSRVNVYFHNLMGLRHRPGAQGQRTLVSSKDARSSKPSGATAASGASTPTSRCPGNKCPAGSPAGVSNGGGVDGPLPGPWRLRTAGGGRPPPERPRTSAT